MKKRHANSTGTAVERQTAGGVKLLYKELRENNLIRSQRVVPVLPVQHEVVFIVSVYTRTKRKQGFKSRK